MGIIVPPPRAVVRTQEGKSVLNTPGTKCPLGKQESSSLSLLPMTIPHCSRAEGLPETIEARAEGERRGSHVTWPQGRQLSNQLLIQGPACLCLPPECPHPPCTPTLQPAQTCRHTHQRAAHSLLTHATTPSLTLGACPREPGLHTHTHSCSPAPLHRSFLTPPNCTGPLITAQGQFPLHHSPDVWPWASAGPL